MGWHRGVYFGRGVNKLIEETIDGYSIDVPYLFRENIKSAVSFYLYREGIESIPCSRPCNAYTYIVDQQTATTNLWFHDRQVPDPPRNPKR